MRVLKVFGYLLLASLLIFGTMGICIGAEVSELWYLIHSKFKLWLQPLGLQGQYFILTISSMLLSFGAFIFIGLIVFNIMDMVTINKKKKYQKQLIWINNTKNEEKRWAPKPKINR